MDRAVRYYFPKTRFQALVDELWRRGYTVLGPQLDQAAIVYGELRAVEQLPRGWREEQEPGKYRLLPGDPDLWFQFAVGPHSWKRYFFPPVTTLVQLQPLKTGGWQFQNLPEPVPRYAMIGVRGCELAAMGIQDRVFVDGPYQDPVYVQRRQQACLIAVNCSHPANTCFCPSMKTGPRCESGFDLALTELQDGFVCEIGTDLGESLLDVCEAEEATLRQMEDAEGRQQGAEQSISKRMNTNGLQQLLQGNPDHPMWETVAQRCLSCTNCTMVCPTCFCSSVSELTDLQTGEIERQRTWDSCFNPDFSYMNGSVVRDDIRSRYRQWLTHKLSTWHDQFESSGCVGCGRCITWCPVGIDLTEEVATLQGDKA